MTTHHDTGLRRVSVHVAAPGSGTEIDLALPAGIPVATLLPTLVDIVVAHGCDAAATLACSQLSLLGQPPLNMSKTLAQAGIRDGSTLVLHSTPGPPVRVTVHDEADALTRRPPTRQWDPECSRLAAAGAVLAAAVLLAMLAVPGPPGAPAALFGAAAGTAAAGALGLFTAACFGALLTMAAAAAVLCEPPNTGAGTLLLLVSAALLAGAGPLAARSCRTEQTGALLAAADRAQQLLTAYTVAGAAGVLAGSTWTLVAAPSSTTATAQAGLTAAALLLHARTHRGTWSRAALLTAGIGCAAGALFVLRSQYPQLTGWWALALCAGEETAGRLGWSAGSAPPLLRRCADAVECLAVAASVPLAAYHLQLLELP